jgi:mRNA interferase RelE/StbE
VKRYIIKIENRAKRQIRKLDPDTWQQIQKTIDKLAGNPRPQSSKRLKGKYKGLWRARSGNYRIIYEIKEQKLIVTVVSVDHRKNIY